MATGGADVIMRFFKPAQRGANKKLLTTEMLRFATEHNRLEFTSKLDERLNPSSSSSSSSSQMALSLINNPIEGLDGLVEYSSSDLRRNQWAFAKRENILSWEPVSKMPEFRELVSQAGIEWLDLPEWEILDGKRLQNYVITSHRWVYANGRHDDHPDWGKLLCE